MILQALFSKLAAVVSSGVRAAHVTRSTTTSIPDATSELIIWDTEVLDDPGVWAASPAPSLFTIANAGWHMLSYSSERIANVVSTSNAEIIIVNGTTRMQRTLYRYSSENRVQSIPLVDKLAVNDEVLYRFYSYRATTLGSSNNGGRLVELLGPSVQGAIAYASGVTALPTATPTNLQFDTVELDDAGYIDLVSDNAAITIPAGGDGWYVLVGMSGIAASSTGGGRRGYITVNGTAISRDSCAGAITGTIFRLVCGAVAYLAEGDVVRLQADQNRGSTINSETSRLAIVRINTTDGAVVYRSTAQSIPANTATPGSFDTEVTNTDGYYSSGSPTRFTVPTGKSGWHVVYGAVHWSPGSYTAGHRRIWLSVNGTLVSGISNQRNSPSTHNDPHMNFCAPVYLEAGDYCEVSLFTTNLQATQANRLWFGIARIEDPA